MAPSISPRQSSDSSTLVHHHVIASTWSAASTWLWVITARRSVYDLQHHHP
ncbi:hypothetical protein M3J09_000198 [Ascochyta lentis]